LEGAKGKTEKKERIVGKDTGRVPKTQNLGPGFPKTKEGKAKKKKRH